MEEKFPDNLSNTDRSWKQSPHKRNVPRTTLGTSAHIYLLMSIFMCVDFRLIPSKHIAEH